MEPVTFAVFADMYGVDLVKHWRQSGTAKLQKECEELKLFRLGTRPAVFSVIFSKSCLAFRV